MSRVIPASTGSVTMKDVADFVDGAAIGPFFIGAPSGRNDAGLFTLALDAGHRWLQLAPGLTYLLNSNVTLPGNVTIWGWQSVLDASGGGVFVGPTYEMAFVGVNIVQAASVSGETITNGPLNDTDNYGRFNIQNTTTAVQQTLNVASFAGQGFLSYAGANGVTLASIVSGGTLSLAALPADFPSGTGEVCVQVQTGQVAKLAYTSSTGGGTPTLNGVTLSSGTGTWTVATGAKLTPDTFPVGVHFHHYTDTGAVWIDNVGEGPGLRINNANNSVRRADRTSTYVGGGDYMQLRAYDTGISDYDSLFFIDENAKFNWTGVGRAGVAQVTTTFVQNGPISNTSFAFVFQVQQSTSNVNHSLFAISSQLGGTGGISTVFQFIADNVIANIPTRANISSASGMSNGLAVQANTGRLTLIAGTDCKLVVHGAGAQGLYVSNTAAPSVVIGTGTAIATDATDGFLYIPTCAGAPTGTPTSQGAGVSALVYDTTDSKIYLYFGGWKSVALA